MGSSSRIVRLEPGWTYKHLAEFAVRCKLRSDCPHLIYAARTGESGISPNVEAT